MKIFAALIACLMLLDADAACPRTWQAHRRSCYFVSQNEKASWHGAMVYCRVFGGYLVDINDAEEDHYVRGLATLSDAPHLWIGVNDIQEEGMWRSAHTNKPVEFLAPWGQNENIGGRTENCGFLLRDSKYRWADGGCSSPLPFVCEKPA